VQEARARSALDSLMLESETALLGGGDSDGRRAVQCDTRHLAAHATSAGVPLSSGTSQNDSALDILEFVAVCRPVQPAAFFKTPIIQRTRNELSSSVATLFWVQNSPISANSLPQYCDYLS